MPVHVVKPDDLGGAIKRDIVERRKRLLKTIQTTVQVEGPREIQRIIDATRPLPVDRGVYRRSWKVEKTEEGAVIYNPLPYAAVLEHGRRRGAKMPPLKVITAWVLRKKIVSTGGAKGRAQARSVAYAIARSMVRKGIKARRVLQRSVPGINRAVRDAIKRGV